MPSIMGAEGLVRIASKKQLEQAQENLMVPHQILLVVLFSCWLESKLQSLSLEMSQNAFLRDAFPITSTTTSSKMPSMSTMRIPLGPINGNITRGKELTPELHNKICTLAENGHDIPFIIPSSGSQNLSASRGVDQPNLPKKL
jgi:hypothetical protein